MPAALTVRRLALAGTALALACLAQSRLSTLQPNDGWIVYLAAMMLFAFACGAGDRVGAGSAAAAKVHAPHRFPILFALSIVLSLLAFGSFAVPGRDDWAWALHLLSLVCVLGAAIPIPFEQDSTAIPDKRVLSAWLILALILVFALAVRIWHNDTIPPGLWFDEAREGIAARQILANPSYRPVYIDYIERPAHHAYLVALSFALFGDSVAALRLVPAVFGVLNVLAAYLLFARWFGRGAGLFAATLWAVLRYDLTFARIVFDADTTPFFVMLTLFFFNRGLARRDLRNLSLAGLTLGMGLNFYLPVRLFSLLLAGLAALWLMREVWRARSLSPLRAWMPAAFVIVISALIAVGPVAEFALRNPDTFFNRNATASIFYERAEPDLLTAIWTSTVKHLGMFNFAGDQNGRHDLPGLPMLDPLSGALFLLGVALALRRRRDARAVLMLLLFATLLLAGILSTDFEAPQALRSIGVLPAVIYFVVLSGTAWYERLQAVCSPRSARRLGLITACALLTWTGYANLDTYFNRQETNPIVWKAHSPGETWAAGEMERLAATHAVVLGAKYGGSATIQFLAPGIQPSQIWTGVEPLPSARPFVLFTDSSLLAALNAARQVYPQATVRELRPPAGGEPLAYEMIVD